MAKGIKVSEAVAQSLKMWNKDRNESWDFGTNYSNIGTEFETFVNKYLFPKMQETRLVAKDLGNRFNFLAQESGLTGQLSEEYVIMDQVPVDLNLSKEETLMFKRNYPSMATRMYGPGVHRKMKFTLNDNDNRLNWSTIGDAIKYAVAVYRKRISDINVDEETEIRAMIIDYAKNQMNPNLIVPASDIDDLSNKVFETMLNIQNNSSKYNEVSKASGGTVGRYTTKTNQDDVMILTTDKVKTYLLNTLLANAFNPDGIDYTDRIISFSDLGGAFKTTADITFTQADVDYFRAYGDYQCAVGDKIFAGVIFTFDVTGAPSFKDSVEEIKPDTDLFALVMDVNSIYYKRNTSKLLPYKFYNAEMDEYTYFMHYYSFKAISPFYNKIMVEVEK